MRYVRDILLSYQGFYSCPCYNIAELPSLSGNERVLPPRAIFIYLYAAALVATSDLRLYVLINVPVRVRVAGCRPRFII